MSTLSPLQQEIQRYVLKGNPKVISRIEKTSRDSIKTRLDIYHDGYRLRLIEVLETDYVVLKKVMGEKAFEKLARAYIDYYPSRSFKIDFFGQHLPKFLGRILPYSAHPELSELAAFCWMLNNTIDCADAVAITRENLMGLSPEDWSKLRLKWHSSLQLMTLKWNTLDRWRAAQEADKKIPRARKLKTAVDCGVWRRGIQSYYDVFPAHVVEMLKQFQAKKNFGIICQQFLKWFAPEEVGQEAASSLMRLVDEGMLT